MFHAVSFFFKLTSIAKSNFNTSILKQDANARNSINYNDKLLFLALALLSTIQKHLSQKQVHVFLDFPQISLFCSFVTPVVNIGCESSTSTQYTCPFQLFCCGYAATTLLSRHFKLFKLVLQPEASTKYHFFFKLSLMLLNRTTYISVVLLHSSCFHDIYS